MLDGAGQVMGWLRWKPGDDGRKHAVTGVTLRLPTSGVLLVERLVLDESDRVVDLDGTVTPS